MARWRDALARGIENKFSIFFTWPDSGRINCLRRPWRVSFGCTAIKGFKENLATLYSTVFPINSQVLQGSWILLLFLWICKTFFLWLNASRHRVDIWYMKRDIELKFCVINFGEKKIEIFNYRAITFKGCFQDVFDKSIASIIKAIILIWLRVAQSSYPNADDYAGLSRSCIDSTRVAKRLHKIV